MSVSPWAIEQYAAQLVPARYRYRGAWESEIGGEWERDSLLDCADFEDGLAIIAANPHAHLAQEDGR